MHVQNIEQREKICRRCPIFEPYKKVCNPKLWLNPNTNEVSTVQRTGFIRGCNCAVFVKMRNLNNHCVAGKW